MNTILKNSVFYSLITMVLGGCFLFEVPPDTNKVTAITIEPEILEIYEGTQDVIQVRTFPEDLEADLDYTFSIENDNVAEIYAGEGKGLVTANLRGMTKLTVTTPDGLKTESIINVLGYGDGVGAKVLRCNTNVMALAVGQNEIVSAEVLGGSYTDEDAITWVSSDPGIVEVFGSGKSVILTATGTGVAYITLSNPETENTFRITIKVDTNSYTLKLSEDLVNMSIGQYKELSLDVTGTYTGSSTPEITWTVVPPQDTPNAPPVVEIVGEGTEIRLRAIASGTQQIIASIESGARARMTVTVDTMYSISAEGGTSHSGEPGTQRSVNLIVTPANAPIEILSTDCVASLTGNVLNVTLPATETVSNVIVKISGTMVKEVLRFQSKWNRWITPSQYNIFLDGAGSRSFTFQVSPPGTTVIAQSNNAAICSTYIVGNTVSVLNQAVQGATSIILRAPSDSAIPQITIPVTYIQNSWDIIVNHNVSEAGDVDGSHDSYDSTNATLNVEYNGAAQITFTTSPNNIITNCTMTKSMTTEDGDVSDLLVTLGEDGESFTVDAETCCGVFGSNSAYRWGYVDVSMLNTTKNETKSKRIYIDVWR